jgi:FkbM family methyltransferase
MKRALKRLRALPLVNSAVAVPLRAAMRATGRTWEPVAKHLPRSGTVTTRLPNGRRLTMVTRGDDWVPNQVFWRGWDGYEPELTPLFYRLAAAAQTTFDIGAHVGFYALLAAHANPAARVFAFEPFELPLRALRRNVAANGLANVEIVEGAVGRAAGRAPFYVVDDAAIPCSSSLSRAFMEYHPDIRSVDVEVIALDEFVAARRLRVDLVKIDTETTEPDVLAGMRETLARDRPHVLLEVLDRGDPTAIDDLVLPLGYQPHLLLPEGMTARPSVTTAPGNWYLMPPQQR